MYLSTQAVLYVPFFYPKSIYKRMHNYWHQSVLLQHTQQRIIRTNPRPDPLLLLVRPIDRVPPPTPTLLTHQHFNQRAVRGSPCKLLHMFISSVTESKSDLNTRRPHRRGKVARMSTYAGWGAEDGKTFVRSPSHISEPRK